MSRASPLSPDARRKSIIAATIPLLRIHGRQVTTAQIAMASGVAEGTLFRVFPDKDALIAAAIADAFEANPLDDAIRAIDASLPLRDKLIELIERMQKRFENVWQLMTILNLPPPSPQQSKDYDARDACTRGLIVDLLEPHRDEFRVELPAVMRLLRAWTFAGSHPRFVDVPFTAAEIVALVLDGVRKRPESEEDT